LFGGSCRDIFFENIGDKILGRHGEELEWTLASQTSDVALIHWKAGGSYYFCDLLKFDSTTVAISLKGWRPQQQWPDARQIPTEQTERGLNMFFPAKHV
jgi:hypothetical protein